MKVGNYVQRMSDTFHISTHTGSLEYYRDELELIKSRNQAQEAEVKEELEQKQATLQEAR
jgi:hypothetical protein